jgi:hypothetical protein
LGVGKIRTCEIFANDEMRSDVFPAGDLEVGEGTDPREQIRECAPVVLFDGMEQVQQLLPAGNW